MVDAIALQSFQFRIFLITCIRVPSTMFQQTDCVDEDMVAKLAATLGVHIEQTLPALWHWLLFLDPVPANQLRRDGHRAEGGLIPNDPNLPNRMWAGSRTQFHGDVAIGAKLRRESAVIGDKERTGRSGKLRVVTIRHAVLSDQGVVIEEDQDIVYRAPRMSQVVAHAAPPPPPGAFLSTVTPDEILLFRFSALTFNAHRIHYDRAYATAVEGYPDLVVHGPLQAILLAGHLRAACPGAAIRTFTCRGLAPAFVGRHLQLEAWRIADTPFAWNLQTRDPSGAICMQAQVTLHHNAA
jgi:3-methylfumaryl-CoA hydratase